MYNDYEILLENQKYVKRKDDKHAKKKAGNIRT